MRAIAVFTESGNTAKLISKYRPKCGIYAFAHVPQVCNWLNLLWGVHPVPNTQSRSAEGMVNTADERLRKAGVRAGDVIGIAAGTQKESGSTNFMRLHVVGAGKQRE
jgi:pyruvate kinase